MSENMQIVQLEVENVKRLKAINLRPRGNVVEIGGDNEQGKSSTLDSIMFALGSQRVIDSKPLRDGAERGYVSLTVGPWDKEKQEHVPKYIISRSFTKAGGGVLTVESTDGARYKSPQSLLDSFLVDFTFDPTEFAKAGPERQKEILMKCVDIAVDEERLKELSGFEEIAFQPGQDPLTKIEQIHKAVYDDRTEVNHEVKRLTSAVKSVEIPEGMEDTKPVSVTELFEEHKRLEAEQKSQDDRRDDLESLNDTIRDLDDEIKELAKKLQTAQALRQTTIEDVEKVAKEIDGFVPPDLAGIKARIAEADETNRIAQQVEEKKKLQSQLRDEMNKADIMTDRLESIKAYKEDLITQTKWPVDGLGFDEEGNITYERIPLSQRGDSQKIKLGLAVNAALNPRLRIILIKHGNDLSSKSRAKIEEWAKANDYQLWVEVVRDEPNGACFFIEDGQVVGGNEEEEFGDI